MYTLTHLRSRLQGNCIQAPELEMLPCCGAFVDRLSLLLLLNAGKFSWGNVVLFSTTAMSATSLPRARHVEREGERHGTHAGWLRRRS